MISREGLVTRGEVPVVFAVSPDMDREMDGPTDWEEALSISHFLIVLAQSSSFQHSQNEVYTLNPAMPLSRARAKEHCR